MLGLQVVVVILAYIYEEVECHGERQRSHFTHHYSTDGVESLTLNINDCTDETSTCVPFIQCPAHIYYKDVSTCRLSDNELGVCCGTGRNLSDPNSLVMRGHHPVRFDTKIVNMMSRHSVNEIEELRQSEARIFLTAGNEAVLHPGPATYSHYRNSRISSTNDFVQVMNVARKGLKLFIATKAFKDRYGLNNRQLEFNMIEGNLKPTLLGDACLQSPLCPLVLNKYRKIDGSCNNLKYPTWGGALSPYIRLLPPNYEDGIWSPRVSVYYGRPLPSPRLISSKLMTDKDIPNEKYTNLLMQFGQFISHDITQSVDTSYENGSAISCCSRNGAEELPVELRHYACMPISIPKEDEFYGIFGQRCINFVRSLLAPRHDCTMGYSQQMNKVTHYIDGSSIYGSNSEQTGKLRSFIGGGLKVFHDYGRDLLPLSEDADACLTMEQGSACFTSGDTRTNQMISLAALHTIFMREHNRIAKILQTHNPHWDDEKLFLESRQIVIAELQVIVYKEFLPAIIGEETMRDFQIEMKSGNQYSYDYDETTDASISNEFSAAAFRFGHSMVYGLLKIYGYDKMEEMISLPEIMFHPSRMRKRQFLDEILSYLTTEPIQDVDHYISDTLTRYMFRGGNAFGVDLAAFNIQRGRDHGLRSYNDYRKLTGQRPLKSFEELSPEVARKLEQIYSSVDDIDLWVGGLLEPKAPGSLVGPTFRDIIADQFSRLKKGDKYFFDIHPTINPGHFTPDQVGELRKATMSRIICDNSDRILLVKQALNAFRKPGVPGNEFYECDGHGVERIDLTHWQETL